jgi:Clostripain family
MATVAEDWCTTPEAPPKVWTVMVYVATDKSSDLDAVAVADLREMERGVKDNDEVHVVAQINRPWPDGAQRYVIRKSKSDPPRGESVFLCADPGNTNMGNKDTLAGFLTWSVKTFPADHYCLVLWGHAYGLGFGRDHNDALKLTEIKEALKEFSSARPGNAPLDLLGANACALSYVEAAYELRQSARYMVASQIAVPFAGWPYTSILRRVGKQTKPEDLGKLIVEAYVNHFSSMPTSDRVTMTLLNLEALTNPGDKKKKIQAFLGEPEIHDFADLIRRLVEEISAAPEKSKSFDRLAEVRDFFIGAAAGDIRPLIDLRDLCKDLGDLDSDLNTGTPALSELVDPSNTEEGKKLAPLGKVAWAIEEWLDETVVVLHRGHPELADLHGIGIYAPFVTDDEYLKLLELEDETVNSSNHPSTGAAPPKRTGRDEYEHLEMFTGDGAWPRLVYEDLRQEVPLDVLNSLTGIDATRSADRRDITQIILAIDSAYNKLDRLLTTAKKDVVKCVKDKVSAAKQQRTTAQPPPRAIDPGDRRFGPPRLKLIQPASLESQLARLRQLAELKKFGSADGESSSKGTGQAAGGSGTENLTVSELVEQVISFFAKVERAVSEAEKATANGLTHAKFGLGPTRPNAFAEDEQPKSSGQGLAEDEQPKSSGQGVPRSNGGQNGAAGLEGDLRADLAFARVAELFGQVGRSLQQLEQSTLDLEIRARTMLSDAQALELNPVDFLKAASQEINYGFCVLEEASASARRTVRRVLSHPVYGIGPSSGVLGLEERRALAGAGGLDRRSLRLL